MRATVVSEGDGAVIRIPASIMREARLDVGQVLELRVEDGSILIAPVSPIEYDLDTLVAGIMEGNKQEIVDFGEPVGDEAW
jgi:antitoxin component of MazEF toxin-antitoxin module